jgi:hypothetical protein
MESILPLFEDNQVVPRRVVEFVIRDYQRRVRLILVGVAGLALVAGFAIGRLF